MLSKGQNLAATAQQHIKVRHDAHPVHTLSTQWHALLSISKEAPSCCQCLTQHEADTKAQRTHLLFGVFPHTSHNYTCCQTVLLHAGIEMSTQYSSLQVEDSAADWDSDSNLHTIKQANKANCNLLCDALQQPPGQGTPAELAGVPYEHHLLERSPMYGVHASEVDTKNARDYPAHDLADAADPAKSDDEQTLLVSVQNDSGREHASKATADFTKDSSIVWYRERAVQLTVIGYGLIAFIYNTADELTPLFAAASPAVGGAGLLANQLAVPLGVCGIVLMLYAVLGYPKCLERYGAAMSCRIGLLATAPLILVTPVAYYVSDSVVAAQLMLCLILGIRIMAETNSFSSSLIMVNTAAPKYAIGKVNGSGQMLASLVRALGPALAGVLWGSSLQLNFPGHQFIPFAALSIVAAGTQFIYVVLKLPM